MKIFISYSRKNRAVVQELTQDLAELGHQIWFDKEINGGVHWWENILQHIRECDLFLVVVSKAFLESSPCKIEYQYAQAVNKHILPVMIETINVERLPLAIQQIQFVAYRAKDHRTVLALNKTLRALPDPHPLPDPLPPVPEIPMPLSSKITQVLQAVNLDEAQQAAFVDELRGMIRQEGKTDAIRSTLTSLLQRKDIADSVRLEAETLLGTFPARGARKKQFRAAASALGLTLLVVLIAISATVLQRNAALQRAQQSTARVFFYNASSGESAIGAPDQGNGVLMLNTCGSTLQAGWSHLQTLGEGELFLYKSDSTLGTASLSRVDQQGRCAAPSKIQESLAVWDSIVAYKNFMYYYKHIREGGGRASVGQIKGGILHVTLFSDLDASPATLNWTNITPVSNGLLFYSPANGDASLGDILPDGTARAIFTAPINRSMTHVRAVGDKVLLYNSADGSGAVVKISLNRGLFTVMQTLPPGTLDLNWTHLSSVGEQIVFYRSTDGESLLGTLEADGKFTVKGRANVGKGWTAVLAMTVPTEGS